MEVSKADRERLKKFHKGRLIKVKYLRDYSNRGWIARGPLQVLPGGMGVVSSPDVLTEQGLAVMRGDHNNAARNR